MKSLNRIFNYEFFNMSLNVIFVNFFYCLMLIVYQWRHVTYLYIYADILPTGWILRSTVNFSYFTTW